MDWEKYEKIAELAGMAIASACYIIYKHLKAKKIKTENVSLKEKIEKHEKINFIDIIKDDPHIQQLICGLLDYLGCDRVLIYMGVNQEIGIGIEYRKRIKNDLVVITHECKTDVVGSEKDLHKVVKVYDMEPVIDEIENDPKGILVVNKVSDIHPDKIGLRRIFEYANVKTAIDIGIYRPASEHRRKYLIGALVANFVINQRDLRGDEIEYTAKIADRVGLLIEDDRMNYRP